MRENRVLPSPGRLPCAALPVHGRSSTHANPLWPTAICEIGRLGDDRASRRATAVTSASAPMLGVFLVDDGRDDQPVRDRQPARGDRRGRRRSSRRRRLSCPARRGRGAGPSRSIGVNGSRHARDADRVGVAAEHQRASFAARPRARRSTLGRPGATPSRSTTSRPPRRISAAMSSAISRFARRAGHQRRVDGVDRRRGRASRRMAGSMGR